MIRFQPRIVKRYFQPLDAFLKLHCFSHEEIGRLLSDAVVRDRRGYVDLVLNACVVGVNDEVIPRLSKVPAIGDWREALYELCIEVNPGLDIKRIRIPVDEATRGELHLLEGAGRDRRDEIERVRAIEGALKSRIIGQDEAIEAVTRTVRRAVAGFRDAERPVATLFFVGQTGVGKTELAKALAEGLYGGTSGMVRVDCSEFAHPHETAKLLGAPPGYVGYDEGGRLAAMLERAGSSFLALFDEIEKSDAKLHDLLLQIMDEGAVADAKGGHLDFKNAIVVLTSNVGGEEIERLRNRIGFRSSEPAAEGAALRDALLGAIRHRFRPEFINRLSEIVLFNPIGLPECERIVLVFLEQVRRRALSIPLKVSFRPVVARHLAEMGYRPEWGARELRRTVEREIEGPLSDLVLEGGVHGGDRVVVNVRRDRLVFSRN